MSGNPFVPAPSLDDVRNGQNMLQVGQKGDAVARAQLLLGIFDDGLFGANTKSAVVAFQRAQALALSTTDEGRIGKATLAALETANASILASLAKIDKRNKTIHLHPALRKTLAALAEALDRRGMAALITDGFRTFAEQDALFAQGRTTRGNIVTNARGGESNHNYGLAVDLYPVLDGRVFTDVPPGTVPVRRFKDTQQAIIDEAESAGLSSGVHFSRVDPPHVQLLAENVLKPRACLDIFRTHRNDFDAVWAEASRHI
jgi:D-alanyl-D-alanine carboxypeptidase./Putative peptidoglycan binding domain.